MTNVYVEPRPLGRSEHAPIDHYVLEQAGDAPVAGAKASYPTQEAAVADARRLGHYPLVARVRMTDKGTAGHWRAA